MILFTDDGLSLIRAMNFGEFVNGKAQQPLPPSLSPHEANLDHFGALCHGLCVKLLRLFALGLRVSYHLDTFSMTFNSGQIDSNEGGEKWFASRHDPSKGTSGSVLRLLHVRDPLIA